MCFNLVTVCAESGHSSTRSCVKPCPHWRLVASVDRALDANCPRVENLHSYMYLKRIFRNIMALG